METMGHQPVNTYKANVLADTALTTVTLTSCLVYHLFHAEVPEYFCLLR